MSFGWDDVFSGGLSTVFNMGESAWNNYLSNKSAKKAAERNYQYSLRYLQNAPSVQVRGLRDAGLNPILAVSGGFSGSSPSQFSGTPSVSSGSGSFAHGVSASANRRLINSQIKAQESIIDKNKADAEQSYASAALSRAEAEFIISGHKSSQTFPGLVNRLTESASDHLGNLGDLAKKGYRYLFPDSGEYIKNVPEKEKKTPEIRVPDSLRSANRRATERYDFVERRTKELGNQRYMRGREADINRSRVW